MEVHRDIVKKAGQIGEIDKHNRRLNKNYISNPDIETEQKNREKAYEVMYQQERYR